MPIQMEAAQAALEYQIPSLVQVIITAVAVAVAVYTIQRLTLAVLVVQVVAAQEVMVLVAVAIQEQVQQPTREAVVAVQAVKQVVPPKLAVMAAVVLLFFATQIHAPLLSAQA